MEVEPEEACAHPEQRDHDEAGGRRVGCRAHEPGDDVGVDEEGPGADRDHAGGQAVEPVDEVDGVHDADDEEDGDEEPQSGGSERQAENRERGQLYAAKGHAARDEDLPAEFGHPVQFDDVIDDAEDAHSAGTGHDGPRDRGRKEWCHVGDPRGEQYRDDQCDGHCDAAQARNGLLLQVPAAQGRQDVELQACPAHGRGQQDRQGHCNGTQQQVDLHEAAASTGAMGTPAVALRSFREMVPRRSTRGASCAKSTIDEAVDPWVGPPSR